MVILSNVTMGYTEETIANSKPSTIPSSQVEELPYFTERYPGKLCCLCNLCERSALGQGDMLKLSINVDTMKSILSDVLECQADDLEAMNTALGRKKTATTKMKITVNNELMNELDNVGHDEMPTVESLASEGSCLYVHSMCAMWSLQMKRIDEDFVPRLEEVVAKSLQRKCSFCLRRGASIVCRMNCEKNFHLPCAAASGCFLIIESFEAYCVEHTSQVPYIAVDTNIECRQCFSLGDISKLLMCSTCGAHYHSTCIGLSNFPDSRSGWNCQQCCKCLICRQPESVENRSIKCEQCQKLYHTTCLRPIISSVPKYGWKCNRCRICSDCGARTPGAGASSRWHCHYTICDSCYQQRNKGFSCPICHKAYRAASHKEMVKCSNCNRFVHSGCDDEADLSVYHLKKETDPDYDYVCPPCKSGKQLFSLSASDTMSVFNDSFSRELEAEFYDREAVDFSNLVDPLKISKKKMGFKEISRGGKVTKLFAGKGGLFNQINRKRSVRGKGRQMLMLNSAAQSSSSADLNSSQCSEDDMSLEKKIVLCSAKDKFVLMQDICVMCGSLGTDQDACLIPCVQCGQCYHPHCANVAISKTMLLKGWRCLDCTVCEGCGQKNDESRLILCDECDISYHIYCMSPPLEAVPNGNWKCKLCAMCQKCGRNTPGKNSAWLNGFLECGPCASQSKCYYCSQAYNDNDLIIQCNSCERWLHCACDNIKNEDEAKHFNELDYQCKMCRKDIKPQLKAANHKLPLGENTYKIQAASSQSSNGQSITEAANPNTTTTTTTAPATIPADGFESAENACWIDGVCVSEHGLNMIRSLTTEIKKKRKLKSDCTQKDAAIMSAIDSVIAGGSNVATRDDGTIVATDKLPSTAYKDGMVWTGEDGSQPEGFSISTNEEGVNILRKKRQRNLQKLGIGGFNVRMRGIRKENEELYMGSLENPSLTDEKKKKIIKKKFKSKLCESYPAYLQEAFFGKVLLVNKDAIPPHLESDSSDECYKLSMDTTIIPSSDMQQHFVIKTEDAHDTIDTTPKADSSNTHILEINPNDPAKSLHMNAMLRSNSVNSAEPNHGQTIIKLENNNIGEAFTSSAMMPNTGKHPIKLELSQHNVPLVHSSSVPPPPSYLHTNMNVKSSCQQNLSQSQKAPQYQNFDQQLNTQTKQVSKFLTQKSEDPMLSQIKYERDALLTQVIPKTERVLAEPPEAQMVVDEAVKEPVVAGTQKTAEKMRKDEDLGEMATISAVLYANTQHPELKQVYPNWTERCKQILKKWRSLSTEMKAPFLQHAKDNRSVLRLRRSQQEPEKTYFQQKSLKEQEQERVWKQHQAKNKETNSSKSIRNSFVDEYTLSESNSSVNQRQAAPLFEINFLDESAEECKPEPINPQQFDDTPKPPQTQLEQQHHQPLFMPTLSQQLQPSPQQSAMDELSKVFEHSKPELTERNDIFLSDKNWAGVGKLPNSKDLLSSGTEKIEADENAGLGDILGGFGEGDDDDILKSLTAEIGDDFNILEYADPELDEINVSQNLLNKLDFDENQKAI